MRIALFYHSLLSDWNHGNAHFLRGVVAELIARGHQVQVYEPRRGWSITHLIEQHGQAPLDHFRQIYPGLASIRYEEESLDLNEALDRVDLVIVHEWNSLALVRRIGRHRANRRSYRLLFHDTHHRSVTNPDQIAAYDLSHYDGVLAFGRIIRDLYLANDWAQRAWTWHEAADVRLFRPIPDLEPAGDLVWIGNWGDEERTQELSTFLIEPAQALGLQTQVYGVRYPPAAQEKLAQAGLAYRGWLPNYEAPGVLARFKVTVHIPRRPYATALPGVPTIRPFEALACGLPLISAPWADVEGLFEPGRDFLVARDGAEMKQRLRAVLHEKTLAQALAEQGRRTILARHTCAHRVDQLFDICRELEIMPDRNTGLEAQEINAQETSS